MTAIFIATLVAIVIVWTFVYYDRIKLLAIITLVVLASISACLYFAAAGDGISLNVKCDRMRGVLITEGNETSCVDRDSIKKIDLDKVFEN